MSQPLLPSVSSQLAPSYLCCIRPFRKEDELAVGELLSTSVMSTLRGALASALMWEVLWEVLIISVAILYVFFHLPGSVCLLLVPGVVGLVSALVWTSHLVKSSAARGGASAIAETFQQSARTGFWVAEVYEPVCAANVSGDVVSLVCSMIQSNRSSAGNPERDADRALAAGRRKSPSRQFRLVFVSQAELQRYSGQLGSGGSRSPRIIGTCGLRHDRRASADAAWLSMLAVAPDYQRCGVASRLLEAALDHASCPEAGGFRCVSAQTSEYQTGARALLHQHRFLATGCDSRAVLFGLSVTVHTSTRTLKPTSSKSAQSQ